jgi:outer membrane protein OmpA-like peptidoglycan-associated protein
MIKQFQHVLAITALVILNSGCALNTMLKKAQQQKLSLEPSPLELHGDSVRFSFSAELPPNMLKKGKAYNLNFNYKYSDQKMPVGGLRFNYLDFPEQKKIGPKLSKKFSFPYKSSSMDKGELLLQGSASNQNDKAKLSPEVSYAKGLILTSQLVQDDYTSVMAGHGYNPLPEYYPITVNFYFDQGSAVLKVKGMEDNKKAKKGKKKAKKDAKESRPANQQALDAYIASNNATKTVTITGMHSPEGREVKNTELSDQRAKAIEAYYRAMMKKLNYGSKADSIEFVTKALVQNWAPLKDTLRTDTSLTADEKKSVTDVLDGTGTYVEQEAALEKLACFPKLLFSIYPKLRLGQTEILTLKPKKSEAELSVLAKAIAEGSAKPGDTLTDKELAYAATLTPILTEKEAIYLAATKKNDSWQSHNNLGATRLEMAKKSLDASERTKMVDKAITNLEISRARMETAEVYANLATAYLMKADWTKIDEIYTSSQKVSGNSEAKRITNTVKGIIESRRGNYPAAMNLYANGLEEAGAIYNKGLTQVLKKEWAAGYASLEELAGTGSKNPMVYYVQAIAAARQNKESDMTAKLKKAFSLDSNLKTKAVSDLEFLNYQNKPSFQDALK